MPPREPVTGPDGRAAAEPTHQPVTGPAAGTDPGGRPSIVDWSATFRRFRRGLALVAAGVLVAWLAVTVARGEVDPRLLAELVGFGLLAGFLVEVVVVGGAAVRGLLVAGERGERLARPDVSLLPPQLRRGGCGGGSCTVDHLDASSDADG